MPCLILSVILVKVLAVFSLKEFSLARYSSALVYANNSVIDINLVGEDFVAGFTTEGGALECHSDDTTCCRGIDDPNGNGKGEWYYPNGTVVPPPNNGTIIYRTRDHMVIRLNRRDGNLILGVYKCVIPGAGVVNITRYITLGGSSNDQCDDLPSITTGSDILYVPPHSISANVPAGRRYVGTIATCPSGYQPVGGSVRACVEGGVWNGTEPTCATPTTKPPISSPPPNTEPTSGTTLSSEPPNTDPGTPSTEAACTCSNTESLAIGVTAVVCIIMLLVIIALLLVYIMSLKKQLKSQFNISGVNPVETVQYETVTESTKSKEGRSCDTEYEGVRGVYEEVDKLREPHPPKGDYELSQCAAYGSVVH